MRFCCRALFFHFFVLALLGCDKEVVTPEMSHMVLPGSPEILSVCHLDGATAFVSGGIHEQEGYIFRTLDGGVTWEAVFRGDLAIRAVSFLDSLEGYACGDSLSILKTLDRGATWEPVRLSWYPNPEYILPLKAITFADDTTWFFTGGRHFQYGINVRTQNGGLWWDNEVFQVELNSAYFRDERHGLLAGYGILYTTPDANVTFIPNDFTGDNLTSLSFLDPMNGLACGYDGGIYSTGDGGLSWSVRVKANGPLGNRRHFNSIGYFQSGCLAVGENGAACFSGDGGATWSDLDLGLHNDLHDVCFVDGHFVVAGSEGAYLRLKL